VYNDMSSNFLIKRKANPTIESDRKLYINNEFRSSSSKELRNAVMSC